MSSVAHSVVTWAEFQRLPERPEQGQRYELHDGEVVIVPPARPRHIKTQQRLLKLLMRHAEGIGEVTLEFPYRPALNLQFWVADVAFIAQADWDAMPLEEYQVYAPDLIIEVLSPSNTVLKVNRQRIFALSAGTKEFWVVDADAHTVQVTRLDGMKTYRDGDSIPLTLLDGGSIPVQEIFLQ